MKLVFLLACLIAVNTVDCVGLPEAAVPTAPPFEEDVPTAPPFEEDVPTAPPFEEEHEGLSPLSRDAEEEAPFSESDLNDIEMESEDDKSLEWSSRAGKGSRDCLMAGGTCIATSTNCTGKSISQLCRGSGKKCCIPGCPEDQGFFIPSGTDQCFKLYNTNPQLTWAAARSRCQSDGLTLAQPYDAVATRRYIMERFGLSDNIWINARGMGSYFRWQGPNYGPIYSGSPLWYPSQPRNSSSSYCITLATWTSAWANYPDQPFYPQSCTSPTEAPLCELKMG